MRIRLLDIKGFGKFQGKRIQPSDGLNLIYGPNESGKSTLVDFVTAALYGKGAGKRYRRASFYSEKEYKPWTGNQYAGVLEYVLDDGSAYRVDRDFEKGLVHVLDALSRDITSRFALGRDTGPRFAEEQLGLSKPVFSRTAHIRQMQSAMDDAGARVLLEKLSNLSTSGSEDLSLSRALEALETALLERVGTDRSSTRPLDRVEERLKELERQKNNILEQHEHYLDAFSLLKMEQERLQKLNKSHSELKTSHQSQLKERLVRLGTEYTELDKVMIGIKSDLTDLEQSLDKGLFGEMTDRAMDTLNNTWYRYQEIQRRLEDCQSSLENMEKEHTALSLRLERLQVVKEKLERIDRVLTDQERYSNEAAPGSDTTGSRRYNMPVLIPVILTIAAVVTLLLSGITGGEINVPLIATAAVLILAGIVTAFLRGIRIKAPSMNPADLQLTSLLEEGFSGLNDYLSQKDELQRVLSNYEAGRQEMAEIGQKIKALSESKEALFKTLASWLAGFRPVTNDPETVKKAMEAFKAGYRQFRDKDGQANDFRQRMEALEQKKRLILREASVLNNREIHSFDELNAAVTEIQSYCGHKELDRERINHSEQMDKLEEDIKNCEVSIGSLNTRLENAPSQEELTAIEEEIILLQERKQELELAGESIKTARDILKEVGSHLQMNYTVQLNTEMSRFISLITNERYQSIRTDPDGHLLLEVPECGELMPVGRLSSGTIDQIYFSMRLAAIRLMERGKETIPLFLDEPFLQYDEERAIQAFKLLRDAASHRQIFFMTSRRRELELAQTLWGDGLNIIML